MIKVKDEKNVNSIKKKEEVLINKKLFKNYRLDFIAILTSLMQMKLLQTTIVYF